jgi:hypothetical protein
MLQLRPENNPHLPVEFQSVEGPPLLEQVGAAYYLVHLLEGTAAMLAGATVARRLGGLAEGLEGARRVFEMGDAMGYWEGVRQGLTDPTYTTEWALEGTLNVVWLGETAADMGAWLHEVNVLEACRTVRNLGLAANVLTCVATLFECVVDGHQLSKQLTVEQQLEMALAQAQVGSQRHEALQTVLSTVQRDKWFLVADIMKNLCLFAVTVTYMTRFNNRIYLGALTAATGAFGLIPAWNRASRDEVRQRRVAAQTLALAAA